MSFSARSGRVSLFFSAPAGKLVVFAFAMLLSLSAFAQPPYISRLGRFQVDQTKGCAPLTVTIVNANLKIASGFKCPDCEMQYEPPATAEFEQYTHTYTVPGTYVLGVSYPSTITDQVDDIVITVLPNKPPSFELYACAANTVVINISETSYSTLTVDFGDGTALVPVVAGSNFQHVYAVSGTYNVSVHGQLANGANNCNPNVKSFQAVAVLPVPVITQLTALDENSAQLDFNVTPNVLVRPQISTNDASSFQYMADLHAVTTTTVTSLLLNDNYYCLRLNTHDACSGADTPSDLICTQKFIASAQSQVNNITWVTNGNILNHTLKRDGTDIATTTASLYGDTDVTCNVQYCYQLSTHLTNGSTSISLIKCVTAFSSVVPNAIDDASAVVGAQGVELSWTQNPLFTPDSYSIERKAAGFSWQPLGVSVLTQFDDPAYTTGDKFCYRISYRDQCLNSSAPGNASCPIRLEGTLDNANQAHLLWTSYRGWKNGVSGYQVDELNAQGSVINTFTVGTDTVYNDLQADTVNQIVAYRITAIKNNTVLSPSVSNILEFRKRVNLYFPTAFTPDHNGTNDKFRVHGFFIREMEMKIFNRWGNMVYSTSSDVPWDGTYSGKVQPNDTYVWTATYTDLTGKKTTQTGMVLLLTQ